MTETCRDRLASLVRFTPEEAEFLNRLLDDGEIVLSLLADDAQMAAQVQDHPLLRW